MGTFVLVHGGWFGGWCYRQVAQRLRAEGHEVYTPTLTGLGERSHLAGGSINLTTHITDVLNVIQWEDLENIVLCGHSYGGMVITGVADAAPHKIGSIVYLDALLPADGQSMWDVTHADFRPHLLGGAAGTGGHSVSPLAAEAFGIIESERAWVDARLTPHPLASVLEAISLSGAHETISKRTYIYATEWAPSPFTPVYERVRQDPRWTSIVARCGHCPMIDRPADLAQWLIAALP